MGKDLLTEEQKKWYGQYPVLGKKTRDQIKRAKLIELPGVGHIPHVQDISLFKRHVEDFLK